MGFNDQGLTTIKPKELVLASLVDLKFCLSTWHALAVTFFDGGVSS